MIPYLCRSALVLSAFLFSCGIDLDGQELTEVSVKPSRLSGKILLEDESHHALSHVILQSASHTYTALTHTDGSFRLTGIVPGSYRFFAGARYFTEMTKNFSVESARDIDFGALSLKVKRAVIAANPEPGETSFSFQTLATSSASSVAGTVTLEGEVDYAGIGVELQNDERTYTVFTHDDGSYVITGVAAGKYVLRLGSRYFREHIESVTVSAGQKIKISTQALARQIAP